MPTNSTKDIYNRTKRLRTVDEVEQYFPGFLAFVDCIEQHRYPDV